MVRYSTVTEDKVQTQEELEDKYVILRKKG